MKRGDKAVYRKKDSRSICEVVHDYTQDAPPFDAVLVKMKGDEWLVRPSELMTVEKEQEELTALFLSVEVNKAIVDAWTGGAKTFRAIADKLGVQINDITSKALKAERHGLIKIERTEPRVKRPNFKQASPCDEEQQMPGL